MKKLPENEKKFDVTGIGPAVVDDLIILPDFPAQDTRVEALQRRKQAGGSVPMALKTLAKLGASTSIIGKIGDDEDSGLIKKQLQHSGIDVTSLIGEKGAKSPYAQVWININNGTRTIAVDSGSAPVLRERNLDFNALPHCKILHLEGKEHDLAEKLIHTYRLKGTKISIDTGRFRATTPKLLDLADIIIMPLKFALDWVGKYNFMELISRIGYKYPGKLVIITDGRMGSICSYRGEIIRQKAFRVNCVDSTGAGGVYAGGVLYGALNDWEIPETLEFAAAAAALNCVKIGNDSLPGLEDIRDFLGAV